MLRSELKGAQNQRSRHLFPYLPKQPGYNKRALRLHLVATLHGLPIGFALTGARADERKVLFDLLHDDPALAASRPGQILIADSTEGAPPRASWSASYNACWP